ncbi:SAF domain-containing protein [Ornithinimicrobium sediminis]|uniref:SAF domain-containing protein n=1 Tax=Ornithinimicrobium sediminis TaxID=2904603 RepID=UPI001E5C875E|nr:SAF domain-containing protein [Ornithinimicrobium sediminis]MCE0485685.1 SAF domain-containing protein [Ornithinimicrobium sediminis]
MAAHGDAPRGVRSRAGRSRGDGPRGGLRNRARRGSGTDQARRWLAALAAGAAVWLVVGALRPPAPDPGPLVLVAASDLPAGSTVGTGDVSLTHVPEDVVPTGGLTDPAEAVGRASSTAWQAGQVLTGADVSVAALADGLGPGTVVAHLPLGNPPLAAAATAGTRVDVLSVVDGSTLATDVLVLGPDSAGGAGLFVALPAERAGQMAAHTGSGVLEAGVTVVLHPPQGG